MVKLKLSEKSKFLNDKEVTELLEIVNSVTLAAAGDFAQVEFTDRVNDYITLNSPFYDFLVSKNRVFPTDYAQGAFRDVTIPSGSRSKFSNNETGSDITDNDLTFNAPVYKSTIVGRKIGETTMLQTGDPSFDYMEYQRQSATQDNYTAIDEGLFNTHKANQFDGIKDTTNNVIDKEGSNVTLDDVDLAVQEVMNRGGRVDGIIATGGAINQLVQSDNDNQKVYSNSADVILGKWSTQIMTASGLVPLISDFNINNRNSVTPANNSDAIFVVDSSAIEIDMQQESISRPLGVTDFSDSELVASFLRMGNLNPYRNAVIKNIQAVSATDMTVVFTAQKAADSTALAGVAITVTQTVNGTVIAKTITTGSDGKASVVVNAELGYSISAAKTAYTTYTHTYTAGGDSAITIQLVAS